MSGGSITTMQELAKVQAKTAAEICLSVDLSEPAKKALDAQITPGAFLARLTELGLVGDAIGFLARAMPKRETVWWGCRCVHGANPERDPKAKAALDSAARWVAAPSEEHRRAAQKAAEQADSTPEGFVALGAFFSGGSVAPPNAPEVKPADDITAKIVTGAIMMAGVLQEPEKAPEKYGHFLSIGIETANKPLPGGQS